MNDPEEFETSLSPPKISVHNWLHTPCSATWAANTAEAEHHLKHPVGSTLLLPWVSEAWNKEDQNKNPATLPMLSCSFLMHPAGKLES